ncbi:MAG: HYR domain-containing protein, partial [Thermoanaerobaculia bacterium]|nr:HYR domain-containing protein [Thermoanaerobaculia bacterium]
MKNLPLCTALILLFLKIGPAALSGQPTFQKYYGDGIISRHAEEAVALPDGYILAGTSNNINPNYRLFFMKIGLDGQFLWMKHYGAPGVQLYFSDLIEANDGGVLAVGVDPDGISTTLLIKTDADGNLEWQKRIHSFAANRQNGGFKLCRADGGYIVSGESKRGDSHATLTRIDNKGNTVWSKRYANQSFDNPRISACFVSGDTIFACGLKDSVVTYNLFRASTGDTLFSQWFAAPGDYLDKALRYMARAPDGDLLLSGYTKLSNMPGYYLWVCRISRSGQLRWSKIYSGVAAEYFYWNGGGEITALGGDRYLLHHRSYLEDPILIQIDGQGEVVRANNYGYKDRGEAFFSAFPTPDGGVFALGGASFPGNVKERLIAVKTDAGGIVEACCTQTASVTAIPYPVQTIPGNISRQFAFDPTTDWGIDATSDSVASGDFCPPQYRMVELPLCPGDSLVIDGVVYTQPGLATSTVPGPKCDTVFTYRIVPGVNPARSETVWFCPGDTVMLHGVAYTQPGTVVRIIPAASGLCDTLATYTLQLRTDTATAGQVSLVCPADILVQVPFGTPATPVVFDAPPAYTDCPCPRVVPEQTEGFSSGSVFPVGDHTVCYRATDDCGNQATCCFQIRVEEDEAAPCDVKTNGCIRFELLRLTADGQGRRTYHFRIQNQCAQSLQYVAFQLPKGVTAAEPGQQYTAPGGNIYSVRNPNFSPVYSIQFKPQDKGINNGASDVFS